MKYEKMKIRRALVCTFLFSLIVGMGVISQIPIVSGLSWMNWTSAAVGDISEYSLPTYWTVTSSPYSGYESYLWSNWHNVINSNVDYRDNDDHEILFTTWSQASTMGIIEFESKAEIEDATEIAFRGWFGVKFTYSQARTIGRVEIYDKTTQTTLWKKDIVSGTTPNTWKWEMFSSGPQPAVHTHDYVIRLVAKDAWISQKVEVAWESAEPWFYSPYYRSLSHGPDTWRHEGWWHYYECRWRSDFYFKSGPLLDMIRDHRPYVTTASNPDGWDPAYVHEFRSVPYDALEGDWWYSHDLPGTVGYTNSIDIEEILQGYEEIEIYTRNPESIISGYAYYISHRYTVWKTGSVEMTLESELVNEADPEGDISPPGYPVAWIDIAERTVSHSSASYWGWWLPASDDYVSGDFSPDSSEVSNETTISINYIEHHEMFDVIIEGIYPYYLKVLTKLNVDSKADTENLLAEMRTRTSNTRDYAESSPRIHATVFLNGLVDVKDVNGLIEQEGIELSLFRFTARNDKGYIRGQGTPSSNGMISLEELEDFIPGYELIGIHAIDVELDPSIIASLENNEYISTIDIAGFIALLNLGYSPIDFEVIRWYSEDPSWYINIALV